MKKKKACFTVIFCLCIQLIMAGCGGNTKEIVWEQTEGRLTDETAAGAADEKTDVSGTTEASGTGSGTAGISTSENGAAETSGTESGTTDASAAGNGTTEVSGTGSGITGASETGNGTASISAAETSAQTADSDLSPEIGAVGSSIPEGQIYVDICGAVVHPGVYRLPEGARLYQAVELAGGLTEEADLTALNQASLLTDGMKIQVYTREEILARTESGAGTAAAGAVDSGAGTVSAGTGSSANDNTSGTAGAAEAEAAESRVNLNTADKETLMTLSGIGEAKAQQIIDWRTENGGFSSIEDLMQVSGIKEGTYNKIKDKIVAE